MGARTKLLRVAALAAGLAGAFALLTVGLPALRSSVPAVAEVTEAIEASGIDAGAIWWSEVPESALAERQVRDARRAAGR